jgi:hypothetical protein
MRLKMLRTIGKKDTLPKTSDNPASPELPFKKDGSMYVEGEVADFGKDDAEKLIKANLAVETDDPVGPPPPPPLFGVNPIPVTVVEHPTNVPHRTEPAAARPGNRMDNRGGAAGGPPSSGDAPKGGK